MWCEAISVNGEEEEGDQRRGENKKKNKVCGEEQERGEDKLEVKTRTRIKEVPLIQRLYQALGEVVYV